MQRTQRSGNMKGRLKDKAIKTHRKCIKVTINFK